MATYYDGTGNQIDISISDVQVKRIVTAMINNGQITDGRTVTATLLGYDSVSDPYTTYGINNTHAGYIIQARDAMMREYSGNPRKIPVILTTDQHGSWTSQSIVKYINSVFQWDNISKFINLGDTANSWDAVDSSETELGCGALESVRKTLSYVPFDKQINVWGNHDKISASNTMTEAEYTAERHHNFPYFRSGGECVQLDTYGDCVVYDGQFNVKYLCIANIGGFSTYYLPTEAMNSIITELSKDDGYDVVVLSHVPLNSNRNDNAFDISTLLANRKTKTSGTITDTDNVTHSYDFTNLSGDLLCGLAGHAHTDQHFYLDNEVLDAVFDYHYRNTRPTHFILIDRDNEQLNIWKAETTGVTNYQVPFEPVASS